MGYHRSLGKSFPSLLGSLLCFAWVAKQTSQDLLGVRMERGASAGRSSPDGRRRERLPRSSSSENLTDAARPSIASEVAASAYPSNPNEAGYQTRDPFALAPQADDVTSPAVHVQVGTPPRNAMQRATKSHFQVVQQDEDRGPEPHEA